MKTVPFFFPPPFHFPFPLPLIMFNQKEFWFQTILETHFNPHSCTLNLCNAEASSSKSSGQDRLHTKHAQKLFLLFIALTRSKAFLNKIRDPRHTAGLALHWAFQTLFCFCIPSGQFSDLFLPCSISHSAHCLPKLHTLHVKLPHYSSGTAFPVYLAVNPTL